MMGLRTLPSEIGPHLPVYPAHRTRTRQAFAVLQLSLQLGLVVVVPVVDGALDVVELTRVAHVESEGRSDGTPVHNHLTCQLCRVAGPKFATPQVVAISLGARVDHTPPPAGTGPVQAASPAFAAPARAPPPA